MDKKYISILDFPSLEYRTLLKVSITLWKRNSEVLLDYTLNGFVKCFSNKKMLDMQSFQRIELLLLDKIAKLPLSKPFAQKLSYFIKPIGLEIMKWLDCQREVSKAGKFLKLSLEYMCWTSYGAVDNRRTAEALINSEMLEVSKQYKLACYYCLENFAKILWEKLSNRQKVYFQTRVPSFNNNIVKIMTYYIRDNLVKLEAEEPESNSLWSALFHAIINGNKAATDFFVGKLLTDLKTSMHCFFKQLAVRCVQLMNGDAFCFSRGYYSEIALILLVNSTKETLEYLSSDPDCLSIILRLFLEWPIQPLFPKVAECILPYTQKNIFYATINIITLKQRLGFLDYNYTMLLKVFFKLSPHHHNIYEFSPFNYLFNFFRLLDEEGVSLVFKGSTPEMKRRMIFHFNGRELCEILAFYKNWNFLRFFIGQCIPDENLESFQETFRKVPVSYNGHRTLNKNGLYGDRTENYRNLYKFVGDLIRKKGTKRNSDANVPVAKRTRSEGFRPIKIKLLETDVKWP